jgi:hypothetical protein
MHTCELELYTCPECYESFTLKNLIQYHLPSIHRVYISQTDFLKMYGGIRGSQSVLQPMRESSIQDQDDSFYELLSPPENAFDSNTDRIWTLPNLDEVFPEPRLSEYLPSQYDLSQFDPARFNPT